MFLPHPTTDKLVEFLAEYVARNGIPKKFRTDAGTVFLGKKFKTFCKEKFIDHIVRPVRDHRENGKMEKNWYGQLLKDWEQIQKF